MTDGTLARHGLSTDIDSLLVAVGRGDDTAFEALFDLVVPRVFGLARRVLRDPVQAEEVAQESLIDVWRSAPGFDAAKGSAIAWIFTITHRRAVDRVRAEQAMSERDRRAAAGAAEIPYDEVAEQAGARFEREQLRRCLKTRTAVQREAITLAYYDGNTYVQVATLLDIALPTVKTRMRDGLIRLRDCLGVGVDR